MFFGFREIYIAYNKGYYKERRDIMNIKELIRLKRKARIKGFIFLFLIPSPGLAMESFAQAEYYGTQIEKLAMEKEHTATTVCPMATTETK